MSEKIDDATMAVIRQEFLGGSSLRDLAARHGVGLRTLASRSKAEQWAVARDRQRSATKLPEVVAAADARAVAVADDWAGRVQASLIPLAGIIAKASELLNKVDLGAADVRNLCGVLSVASQALVRLNDTLTEKKGTNAPVAHIVLNLSGKSPADDQHAER